MQRGSDGQQEPRALLERIWGYTAFRGCQEAAIDALLNKRDVLVCMATGAGKSLIYQVGTGVGKSSAHTMAGTSFSPFCLARTNVNRAAGALRVVKPPIHPLCRSHPL
jgi:hypothetical protein